MFVALYLFFFFVCLSVWFFQNFPRCNIFIKKYHIKLVMFSRDVKNDIRVMLYIKKTKKKKNRREKKINSFISRVFRKIFMWV